MKENWWKEDFDKLIELGFVYQSEETKYDFLGFPQPLNQVWSIAPNTDGKISYKNPFDKDCKSTSYFYKIYIRNLMDYVTVLHAITIEDIKRIWNGFSIAFLNESIFE